MQEGRGDPTAGPLGDVEGRVEPGVRSDVVPVGVERHRPGVPPGDTAIDWRFWIAPFVGALLWPWLFLLLDDLRRRSRPRET